jgi:hypothetical protein
MNCLIPVLSSSIQGGFYKGSPFDTCADWLDEKAKTEPRRDL